jgi:hypothetical protein
LKIILKFLLQNWKKSEIVFEIVFVW